MKILLLISLCALNAFSQEAVNIKVDTDEVTLKPSEEKKKAVVKDKTYDLNNLTTRESRALTQFQIATGVGFDTGGLAAHLTLGKQLTRDLWLQARAAFPVGIDNDESFFFGELGLKIFTGNSFFITPSLFYASGESLDEDLFVSSDSAAGGGLMFTIGNEWRINKNLVIGADWIGLGYHLVEFEEDVRAGVARLLVFNIGYSF